MLGWLRNHVAPRRRPPEVLTQESLSPRLQCVATREAARFIVVQHADKQRLAGDPGLSALGHYQAGQLARDLGPAGVVGLYSSPQRRALETAAPIALATGVAVTIDGRLSERMNWEGPSQASAEAFFAEWERTVADRDYVPSRGDSSRAAAARFAMFLDQADRGHRAGPIVVVSHGGVTIDLLRDLIGDERLEAAAPGVMDRGMPPCGLTTLAGSAPAWCVLGIGAHPSSGRLTT